MDINLTTVVKGSADLECIKSGGVAVYDITAADDSIYQLEINLADKKDVGETAVFMPHYEKALYLMRWIRRAIDSDTLIKIK